MPGPSQTAQPGVLTRQYISAGPMIDKREFQKYLIMPQKSKANLALMMMQLDMVKAWKPTADDSAAWSFYTNTLPAAMELIDTTGATITNGNTNTMTVVLASAAVSGFVRKDYKVRIGQKTGYVYSVARTAGVATMVIKTFDGSNFAGLTAGTPIPVVGNAFGEGSNGQTSLKYPLGRLENFIQISKEADEVTDVAALQEIESPDGETYTYITHLMMYERMLTNMSTDLFASAITPNGFASQNPSLVNDAGEPVQAFRGIDQYAKTFGVNSPTATTGVQTTADFAAMEDAAIAAFNPSNEYIGLTSTKAMRPFANYGKNLTGVQGLQAVRMDANGHELDLMVTRIVTPGGFDLTLCPLHILDDPRTLGVTDMSKNIYWVPRGNVATSAGDIQQRMLLRYKEQFPIKGNGDLTPVEGVTALKIREIHTGPLAPFPAGGAGKAIWRTDLTAYYGLEIIAPEHIVWQQMVA